ncbi:MAG: hypothetical protein ACXAES_13910, partial [Promethearchaeota archaeon]
MIFQGLYNILDLYLNDIDLFYNNIDHYYQDKIIASLGNNQIEKKDLEDKLKEFISFLTEI